MHLVVLRLPPLVRKIFWWFIFNRTFNVFLLIKATHLLYRVIRSKSYYMGKDSRHATAVDTSNTFGCSAFTALRAKNMVVAATVVMISLSPMFFLRSKLLSPLMVIIILSPIFHPQMRKRLWQGQ